jgi:Ca-activated chloride channel family protein
MNAILVIPGTTLVFARPWWMLAAFIVVLVAAFWSRGRQSAQWPHSRAAALSRARNVRTVLAPLVPSLRWIAALALVLVCGRPQLDEFNDEIVEGIDLFVALDMSGSMSGVDMTAQEIDIFHQTQRAEPPNRFNIAVATLKALVATRERDRIGMVVFARDAFLQFPLTLDYTTIEALLTQLQMEQIDASATAIGNAIGLSVRGLIESEATSKAIILITDGKQQGGNISVMQAASLAAEEGIRIYPVLVGREGPTMAPTNRRYRDGSIVYHPQEYPVDPELLASIAETSGGEFYRAENREELEQGLGEILDALETTVLEEVSSVRRREVFTIPLWIALGCLLLNLALEWVLIRRFP